MQIVTATSNAKSAKRFTILYGMLARLRDETYAKLKQLRQDQREESPSPGDEADTAHCYAEAEARANLIERAEDQLRLIDEALARVSAGTYGACVECGDDIAIERLRILPFAALCIDCQSRQSNARGWGRPSATGSWSGQWGRTASAAEGEELDYLEPSEDAPALVSDLAFEPDEPEAPKRRRGRPRKMGAGSGG